MKQNLRVPKVLCVLVSWALVVGCGDGETSYTPCASDADCLATEACVATECRPATACTDDSGCADGRICLTGFCRTAECNGDADCNADHHCEEHRCVDGPRCTCATDADCAATDYCKDNCTCELRPPQPCTADSECQVGQLCLATICQTPPTCTSDTDCPSGTICEGVRCARPCGSDSDCPQYHSCVASHCLQQCISDATCQVAGTICVDNLCVPAECTSDSDCSGQNVRCRAGRCETYTPCTIDADCNDINFTCIDSICEERQLCAIDGDCQGQELCIDGHCQPVPTCQSEDDCETDRDCVAGLCVPHVCRGPQDCPSDQICLAGECVAAGDPGSVYSVVILTPGGPIRQGQSLILQAIALNQAGHEVAGIGFDWSSSVPARATLDAAGILTGGTEAGETSVTATAQGTSRESDPVVFTNFLEVGTGVLRVTVVDAADRTPVAGATVLVEDSGGNQSVTTDASGMAEASEPTGTVAVHVFHTDHDYVSVIGTSSLDLLVPLPPRSSTAVAGGLSGQMTFTGEGAVSLGLAGLSIAGSLVDLDFARLMGQIFNVTLTVGTQTVTLPLPAQLVLGYTYGTMPIPIKDTYYSMGQRGLRTAWGMGGRLDGSVLWDLVGGGGSVEEVLIGLLPYFSLLNHGLVPTFDVFPIPLIADANDLDGDGDTSELRPDWANLPDQDLAPTQPQNLAVEIVTPNLPIHGASAISTIVFAAGALTPLGFTPLGLSAVEAPGGEVPDTVIKLAPVYGGLEVGDYAVLAIGFPPGTTNDLPTDLSAVVFTGPAVPTRLEFPSEFLGFPDAGYDSTSRTLSATGTSGATVVRATFRSAQGGWDVYTAGADPLAVTLPVPPSGPDPTEQAAVTCDPILLQTGIDFETLVSFNGDDLDQLNRLAVAFSRFQLP